MKRKIQSIITVIIFLVLNVSIFGQTIIYVDADVSGGSNNGTSWANAYTSLQAALDNAVSTNQIWVANGTYYPSIEVGGAGNRYKTFQMKDGVAIYGGFAGSEDEITDRTNYGIGEANETILSGDLSGNDNYSVSPWTGTDENCYHVIFNPSGLTTSAVLDGFTIKGGYADFYNESNPYFFMGGGIYNASSSPTISNCSFINNYGYYGGGIYNLTGSGAINNCIFTNNTALYNGAGLFNYGESSLAVSGCIFDNNTASDAGGGIAVWSNSNSTITDCIFRKNSAVYGGGAWINQSPVEIVNCLFSGNTATYGGGIEINDCASVVFNCTFGGNSAVSSGGGIYNSSASPIVTNSIFWGNFKTGDLSVSEIYGGTVSNFSYCCIQGGSGTYTGIGNIFVDPAFFDADGTDNIFGTSDDDFSLRNSSPCIGAGTNTGASANDILGVARGNPPDMGAYENSLNSPTTQIIYVSNIAGGANNGSTWNDAYLSLSSALNAAIQYDQIWVAKGTYFPTSGTDRSISFEMKNDVKIYGGFSGDESSIGERNDYGSGGDNETVLSGNINDTETNTDNSYHVISNSSGINTTALLDGFTISGGYADGSDENINGGGMHNSDASPKINNCIFINNYAGDEGGGMANYTGSAPEISNCTFNNNTVIGITSAYNGGGGAICNYGSSPTITNCIFINNTADDNDYDDESGGGAISNKYSSSPQITACFFKNNIANFNGGGIDNSWFSNPEVVNCVFTGNTAVYGGGFSSQHDTSPIVTNCSFSGNTAYYGGGFISDYVGTHPVVKNTIFWGNSEIGSGDVSELFGVDASEFSYCCIRGGSALYSGSGNIFSDPSFTDADGVDNLYGTSDDDLSLQDESPCIGAGTSTGSPATDILSAVRGTPPDMGAYENSLSSPLPVELISFTASVNNSTVTLSWQTATEVNNYGFDIECKMENGKGKMEWENIGFVEGHGNSNSTKEYSFTDNLSAACLDLVHDLILYRLKQIDTDGLYSYSQEIEIKSKAEDIPSTFELFQNYPNPFNPTTTIKYSIAAVETPYMASLQHVTLEIFDVLGREVATLVDEYLPAGSYEREWNASELPSGIYFCRMEAGDFTAYIKLLLLK
ncbi:MAG: right-handed parallel beta-helix repeat-containing protein [bacterium]